MHPPTRAEKQIRLPIGKALIMLRVLSMAILAALPLCGQGPLVSRGFEHFYNLEYDQALSDFEAVLAQNPQDANFHNHIAQTVLYRAMFRAGALESELVTGANPFLRRDKVNPTPADQKRFDDAISASLSLSQAALKSHPDDPRALYSLGVAYGLRANYNFLVRKAWMDALKDATRSRKAHNRVTQLEPNNIDARLIPGVHDYVVGSLPFAYKVLGFLAGFHGDREEGIETLRLVAAKGDKNKYDAQILLSAIYRREHRAAEAVPLVEGLLKVFPRNYLLGFELAQMYADSGKPGPALATLRSMEDFKRSNAPGYQHLPAEKIFYHEGNLQFWYRDFTAAEQNLRKAAVKAHELDLNTGVLAWMRLGQTYDMLGRRGDAQAAYQEAIQLAPQSELARESKRYLASPYRRTQS